MITERIEGSASLSEVDVTVSDLHLSAGTHIRVRVKLSFFGWLWQWVCGFFLTLPKSKIIEIENPLEDFHYDQHFSMFLETLVREYGHSDILRLRLMGDVFDPLAVPWHGRFQDPPFEIVGAAKMRKIIRGHKIFFDALTQFVRGENRRIVIFVGNHDEFLAWPKVQRELIRRIAGNDQTLIARIRFVDQKNKFQEEHRGVLYDHGMNSENHNRIDPETVILYDHFGKKLERPVLNKPYGSHMSVGLANPLKIRNPLVGRVPLEKDIWIDAVKYRWSWVVYAGFMLVWIFIYNQLFAFWDVRRKTGLTTFFGVVRSTTRIIPVDEYALRLLKEREHIRVAICGHSHIPRLITGPDGTYINTGSWALRLKFVWPKFVYQWKRFRWIEVVWRTLLHFLRTGELQFAKQLTKLCGFIASVLALVMFLAVSFSTPVSASGFFPLHLYFIALKFPLFILLVFLLVAGVFRFFAVSPQVVHDTQFTFALVRYGRDGTIDPVLMEFVPVENVLRKYI